MITSVLYLSNSLNVNSGLFQQDNEPISHRTFANIY